jgi:hypothetical protein
LRVDPASLDLNPLSTAAAIFFPTRRILAKLRAQGASTLTQYRVLLVARWLLGQLDSPESIEDYIESRNALMAGGRLEEIAAACRRLVGLLGIDPATWPAPKPKKPPEDDNPLQICGLPPMLRAWPRSVQNLARALLAISAADLDATRQAETNKLMLRGVGQPKGGPPIALGLEPRYSKLVGRTYKADASRRRDPFAVLAARILDRVLQNDPKTRRGRVRRIGKILDATYPKGYRTPESAFGARAATGRWEPRTIERWLPVASPRRPRPRQS